MQAAYLKLRQLIDAGCVFIGHGLKKDFGEFYQRVNPSLTETKKRSPNTGACAINTLHK